MARIIFGASMSIQAPPNLNPGKLTELVNAGINDWGGVSPLTPDHVNPESPWPHLDTLAAETKAAGKLLQQRLTIYPQYLLDADKWLSRWSSRMYSACVMARVLAGRTTGSLVAALKFPNGCKFRQRLQPSQLRATCFNRLQISWIGLNPARICPSAHCATVQCQG